MDHGLTWSCFTLTIVDVVVVVGSDSMSYYIIIIYYIILLYYYHYSNNLSIAAINLCVPYSPFTIPPSVCLTISFALCL